MATVPCPAITSGSSNGGTKVAPSLSASFRAWARAWGKLSPCNTTWPPRERTPSTLSSGVVVGITMVARMPSSRAARATPWAWLPAEAVITPRWRWAGLRRLRRV
ncbi:hypothetical protein D3C79_848560 [compost metagenome]